MHGIFRSPFRKRARTGGGAACARQPLPSRRMGKAERDRPAELKAKRPNPARSRMMAAVRQRGTAPEMAVRRSLRALGYRYQCNCKDLPGSPDLVVQSESLAILVHGCFWHRHRCSRSTTPKNNQAFWLAKFAANRLRDARIKRSLRRRGWRIVVVWECWTQDAGTLERRLSELILQKQSSVARRATGNRRSSRTDLSSNS